APAREDVNHGLLPWDQGCGGEGGGEARAGDEEGTGEITALVEDADDVVPPRCVDEDDVGAGDLSDGHGWYTAVFQGFDRREKLAPPVRRSVGVSGKLRRI